MGASFALALKQARSETAVVGVDRNEVVVRKALERGIVESANTDMSPVEIADVVVVGAPIGALRQVFAQLAARAPGRVVTDMASTKASVVEWAAAEGIDLVGGHPMCGKEASGIDEADARLFAGAPWVLTRSTTTGWSPASATRPSCCRSAMCLRCRGARTGSTRRDSPPAASAT
jgi:prephenate dehydrogenase